MPFMSDENSHVNTILVLTRAQASGICTAQGAVGRGPAAAMMA